MDGAGCGDRGGGGGRYLGGEGRYVDGEGCDGVADEGCDVDGVE